MLFFLWLMHSDFVLVDCMGFFIQDLGEVHTDVCNSLVLWIVCISVLPVLQGQPSQDALVLATVCK